MQIQGNGSTPWCLEWFQDRSDTSLPMPWVLSVPLLVYRVAMLAWALWLALSVLGWLKWGWSAFSAGGLWLKSRKEAAGAAPQATTTHLPVAPPASPPSGASDTGATGT